MQEITLNAARYRGDVRTSAEMLTGSVKTSDTIRDTQAKDSFVRSMWFKVLTLGIGAAVLAIYDAVNDPKREQKVADLKRGTRDLCAALTDFANNRVPETDGVRTREVTMFGGTVVLMQNEQGMHVKMAGDDGFTFLGKTAHELRQHLVDDMFAHVDVFRETIRDIVTDLPADIRDETKLEESYTRRICQGAVQAWSGLDASKLGLVTTANLKDLAQSLVQMPCEPDAANENGKTVRQIAQERIAEFDVMISADRINSMDAEVLLDALHEDVQADAKVTLAPNFGKPPAEAPAEEARQPVHTEGERKLVADFVLSQNVENLDKMEDLPPEALQAHRQFVKDKMAEFDADPQRLAAMKTEYTRKAIDEAVTRMAEKDVDSRIRPYGSSENAFCKRVNALVREKTDECKRNREVNEAALRKKQELIERLKAEIASLDQEGGVMAGLQKSGKLVQVAALEKEVAKLKDDVALKVDRAAIERKVRQEFVDQAVALIRSGEDLLNQAASLPENERSQLLQEEVPGLGRVDRENVVAYRKAREDALGRDEAAFDRNLTQTLREKVRQEFETGDATFASHCLPAKMTARARQFKAVVRDNQDAFVDVLLNPRDMGESEDLLDQALDLLRSNAHVLNMFTLTVDADEFEALKAAFGLGAELDALPARDDGTRTVKLSDLMLKPAEDAQQGMSGLHDLREGFRAIRSGGDETKAAARGWLKKAVSNFLEASNVADIRGTVELLMGRVEKTVATKIDGLQNQIADQIDRTFKPAKIKKLLEAMSIDEMMDEAMRPTDGGYTTFIKNLLKGYFKEMPLASQLKMVSAGIRFSKDGASDSELLGAVFKGAGPLLQKVLQGIDEGQLTDSDLATAIKDMKSNLAPIPQEVVKAHLLDIVNRSGGAITRIEADKSLGCASIAQAITCRAFGPGYPPEGKPVVVKIVRPDALSAIRRERDFVMRVARQSKMEESYAGQIQTILEEFDFVHEAENLRQGEVYDTGYPRLKSVKSIPLVETVPGTLIMELAPGSDAGKCLDASDALCRSCANRFEQATTLTEKLAAMRELGNHLRTMLRNQQDMCDLSSKWVTEGLYGGGFFHGDLHAGNIMVDGEKGVTLIDFGNTTRLTGAEQKAITRVATAAALPAGSEPAALDVCVRHFAEGFKELLKGEEARAKMDSDEVRTMIRTVLGKGDAEDAGKRILVIISQLQRQGVDIPAPIFKFSQSQMRLQNTLEAFNRQVSSVAAAFDGMKLRLTNNQPLNLVLLQQYHNAESDDGLHTPADVIRLLKTGRGEGQEWREQAVQYYAGVLADAINACLSLPPEERAQKFEERIAADPAFGESLLFLMNSFPESFQQLKELVTLSGEQSVNADSQDIRDLALAVVEKEIEMVESLHEVRKSVATSPLYGNLDGLKSFPDCMGKVVKQNLAATAKRLDVELMNALR